MTNVDYENKKLFVLHNGETMEFPLINNTIFNIYNEITVIALFLEFGITKENLYKTLEKVKITETRYDENIVNNIKILKIMAKGNNSLPASLVFDYVRKQNSKKAIVLALDDLDVGDSSEFIGWIYDADYEFLNQDNIKHIIISGKRCYDQKLRVLLAGIPSEKIVCNPIEKDAVKGLDFKDLEEIYILHDMSTYKESVEIEKVISKMILEDK